MFLEVANEQIADDEEDRQPHAAVPERGILGHDPEHGNFYRVVNDISRQRILAERAEYPDREPATRRRAARKERREPGRIPTRRA